MKRPFRIILPALAAVALLTLSAVAGMLAFWGGENEDPGPDMGLLFLPDEEETAAASSPAEQEPSTEPENETEQPEQTAPPQENPGPTDTEEASTDAVRPDEEDGWGDEARLVRFSVGGNKLVVQMEDHPAAQAFYEILPLELNFSDYNRTEKIAYLEEELPTDGAPDNCDPKVGDLCYYIPWGNLCFFYEDFRRSESLVPLGGIVSGEELLEQLDTARSVWAEAADELKKS